MGEGHPREKSRQMQRMKRAGSVGEGKQVVFSDWSIVREGAPRSSCQSSPSSFGGALL